MRSFAQLQSARYVRSRVRQRRAGGAPLPPGDRSLFTWAFDPAVGHEGQSHRSIIGPTATLGSSLSADSNDPTRIVVAPFGYGFDINDYLDFGNNMNPTLQGAFTFQIAIEVTAGDIAAPNRAIFDKGLGIEIGLASGFAQIIAYHAGVAGDFDRQRANAALMAGKHVLTFKRNTGAARGARHFIYVNGALVASTHTASGLDGVVAATANVARLGMLPSLIQPVASIGSAYVHNALVSDATVAANANYTRVTRGWS